MKYFFKENEANLRDLSPGVTLKTMWGEKIMMMLVDISPHAEVPTHTHPNEQAGRVLSGSFKLIVDGDERLLKEGDHYLIPPNVPHSAHGNDSNSLALDIFSPPREDYKKL